MSRDTGGTSRRRFLTASGTLLGGLAAGTSVAAAESEDRFIVDVAGVDWDALTSEVEVLHDLREIDAAVVRGHSADLERVTTEFAPDTSYELDLPHEADVPAEPTDESATDEPLYPFQWDKQAQGVPSAHEVTRGDGTRVAVIDTGVDPAHPDLADAVNEDLSRNFAGDDGDFRDIGYHGTHVSGIVAASDENETGIVGTAPGTDLVALRVFGGPTAGFGTIRKADHHVDPDHRGRLGQIEQGIHAVDGATPRRAGGRPVQDDHPAIAEAICPGDPSRGCIRGGRSHSTRKKKLRTPFTSPLQLL